MLNLNKTTLATAIIAALLLTGCTEEINVRQEGNLSNGVVYKKGESKPFSGKVMHYPATFLGLPASAECESNTKNGLIEGKFECSISGKHIYSANFKQGKRNGIERRYYRDTGALGSETHYSNGAKEGKEKAWSKDGKKEITNLVWSNGKQTGLMTDNNGSRFNYLNGEYHGLVSKIAVFDGHHIFLGDNTHYKNGKKDGAHENYIAPEKLKFKINYKNDELVNGTVYEYAQSGHGEQIAEYSITQIDNPFPDKESETLVVYDGVQKGTSEAGDFTYEAVWNKGILSSAQAYKTIKGEQVQVYSGSGVAADLPQSISGDFKRVDFEHLVKDGIENVFHGDEFVGQVYWDSGRPAALAIKYNLIHSEPKDSTDFELYKPDRSYLNHEANQFNIASAFPAIYDNYVHLHPYHSYGTVKLESYKDSIENTEPYKELIKRNPYAGSIF